MVKRNKPQVEKFIRSLLYAISGLKKTILSQKSFKIQLLIGLLAILMSFLLELSKKEWCVIIILIGIVLSAEAFNTTIELLLDFFHPEKDERVGTIKDIAAGAVLITSVSAIVVGIIIFLPKIILFFRT